MKYLTVICTKLEWDRTKNSINNKINTALLQLTDVYWINDSNDVITACDRNIILEWSECNNQITLKETISIFHVSLVICKGKHSVVTHHPVSSPLDPILS